MSDAPSDTQLLRDFAQTRSEAAFAQLVSRYLNLVYSAAVRQVRHPQAAEDVTQSVFAILARKAPVLVEQPVLPLWLLSATRYTCLDLLKQERRRKSREEKVARMRPDVVESEPVGGPQDELLPLLDAALAHLGEADRSSIILKFLSGTSDAEAANLLGVSDNALRQRRFRSLKKMREFFQRQGVSVGTETLASAMAAEAVRTAPSHLAAAALKFALSGAGTLSISGIKGLMIMAWIKSNVAAIAAVIVLFLVGTALLLAGHIGSSEPRVVAAHPQSAAPHVSPKAGFGPGERIPANAYASKVGAQDFPGGVGYLDTASLLKFARVDFGTGAAVFQACVAVPADHAGKQIVVRRDAPDGQIIARLTVQSTGGWGKLAVQSTRLGPVEGIHDVYLSFTGSGVANLFWLVFLSQDTLPEVPAPATQPAAAPGSFSTAK